MVGSVRAGRQGKQTRGAQALGQSLVEFALLFPILILVVMGLLAFGLLFSMQITLTDAGAAGARQAVVEDYSSKDQSGHYNQTIYNAVLNGMGWLGKSNIQTITIFKAAADGSMEGPADTLDANGGSVGSQSFPNSMRWGAPGIYIGVEIAFQQTIFVPIINQITGDQIILRGRRIEMARQ